MTGATRLTYLLLGGCAVLICVSAYLLLSQASALADSHAKLEATKLQLARRQAQLLVLTDALIATEDQAKQVDKVSGQVTTICTHQADTNAEIRALCALSQWATSSSGRFLAAYATAAGERANADSAADWAKVRAHYAALPALLTTETDPGQLWAARVMEGQAYSDFRLGKLADAAAEADRAYALDHRSAFVGLTRLKIACAKKASKDQVRRQFDTLKKDLEASAQTPVPPMDKTYAGYELGYFKRDAELRSVCAYVELPKVA
jgi:methyl coenzyme M reductase alpha subunit